MKIKTLLFLLIFLYAQGIHPSTGASQDSLIEILLNAQESLVSVKAITISIIGSDKPSAIKGPNGRIGILKKKKKQTFVKQGAGVIISKNGVIATNLHTIIGADQIFITLNNKKSYKAKILKIVSDRDIALVKIPIAFPITPITFANSNKIKMRDEVINVGHSYLWKGTLSSGIVTGYATDPQSPNEIELIKTDIHLLKGDSGGPLLDRQGRLLGIITAKTRGRQEAVFAVPSNKIKKLYLDYLK